MTDYEMEHVYHNMMEWKDKVQQKVNQARRIKAIEKAEEEEMPDSMMIRAKDAWILNQRFEYYNRL